MYLSFAYSDAVRGVYKYPVFISSASSLLIFFPDFPTASLSADCGGWPGARAYRPDAVSTARIRPNLRLQPGCRGGFSLFGLSTGLSTTAIELWGIHAMPSDRSGARLLQ